MYNTAQGEKGMDSSTIGFGWTKKRGISPLLLHATATTGRIQPALFHSIQSFWILDYEFAEYGKYRIRTASAPWQKRLAGTAHLYPPHTSFWEDTRNAEGTRNSVWIFFTCNHRGGIDQLIHRKGYARFLDSGELLGNILLRCARIGEEQGENGFWEAQSMLCRAFHLLINSQRIKDETCNIGLKKRCSETSAFEEEVNSFFKHHISEKITLEDIAKHLHVSKSLLSHRYGMETGDSPIAKLIRMRINYSKTFLLKGYPLKAIAEQLGFSDEFHFSKTFKQIEGISPRRFIENAG